MTSAAWIVVGLATGVIAMLPLVRLLLRRAERRARRAERRARDAERLAELGSMTSGLAHEIKNPLSTIGLNAQLLGEGLAEADLPGEQRERLRRRLNVLAREAERLRGILDDFLQFAGRVQPDAVPRNLSQIITEISDFFHPQCDQAGITLRTDLPPDDVLISADEKLLKQALLNLMLNATQAMGPPPVNRSDGCAEPRELILRVEADSEEARVRVIDTGPGIPRDRVEGIFRPYVSHRAGGTGLGLPTARRIVEEHGGRLTVHSEPGRGSEFTMHLPRREG